MIMSPKISTPIIRNQAAKLRHNPTQAEASLWNLLRAHQINDVHFRRQYAIGKYIVDFCAPRKKLVIELDGQPHTKSGEQDDDRSTFLRSRGYKVLRFWNHDVLNDTGTVIQAIKHALDKK